MQRRKNLSTDQNKNKIKGEETSAPIKTRIKSKEKKLQHNLSTDQNKNKSKKKKLQHRSKQE